MTQDHLNLVLALGSIVALVYLLWLAFTITRRRMNRSPHGRGGFRQRKLKDKHIR